MPIKGKREAAAETFRTVRGRRLGLLARPSLLLLGTSPPRRRRRVRRRRRRFRRPRRLRLHPLRAPPGSPRPSSRSPPWPSRRATRCCARASSGPRRASRAGGKFLSTFFFRFPFFCFERELFFSRVSRFEIGKKSLSFQQRKSLVFLFTSSRSLLTVASSSPMRVSCSRTRRLSCRCRLVQRAVFVVEVEV